MAELYHTKNSKNTYYNYTKHYVQVKHVWPDNTERSIICVRGAIVVFLTFKTIPKLENILTGGVYRNAETNVPIVPKQQKSNDWDVLPKDTIYKRIDGHKIHLLGITKNVILIDVFDTNTRVEVSSAGKVDVYSEVDGTFSLSA